MYKNKDKLFYKRLLFYIKERRCPWRLLWAKPFIYALFQKPIKTIRCLCPLIKMEITVPSFVLQFFGAKALKDTLEVCSKLNLKPFLIYGTLLGFVRDGGFIKHDSDIDLGLLGDDFKKKDILKQDMITKGYVLRKENEYVISFCHPKFNSLIIDYFLIYEKNGQMASSAYGGEEKHRIFTYYFQSDIFKDFKLVSFEKSEVLIPLKAEEFLSVTYGDWKTPKKVFDEKFDPINLKIEEKTV